MKEPEINAEEAEKLYAAEWPILNEKLKHAIAIDDLIEAKKCRQQLSYLSQRYIARKQTTHYIEEDEVYNGRCKSCED